MSVIGRLVVNAGVQAYVIYSNQNSRRRWLRHRPGRQNGPLADFKYFGFEARPQTFGLRIIIAVARGGSASVRLGGRAAAYGRRCRNIDLS